MKLFTEKQVDLSALIAGPLPPGFLIYKNYKALGKEKQAYVALASTLLFTIAFSYVLIKIPDEVLDKIPNFVFTAFYGVLVFLFFRYYMAKDVESAIESGAKKGSNWAVAGITILGFVLNMIIIFGLAIDEPFYDGELLEISGNELYYDKSVPLDDVNKLVSQFEIIDFFGADYGNIARIEDINNAYYVTLVVDEQFWSNPEIIDSLKSFKTLLAEAFGKPTELTLESFTFSGTSKYKEL